MALTYSFSYLEPVCCSMSQRLVQSNPLLRSPDSLAQLFTPHTHPIQSISPPKEFCIRIGSSHCFIVISLEPKPFALPID